MHTVNGGKEEKKRNKFDWLRKEDNIEIAITMPEEQWVAHGGVQACDLCYSRKVCMSLALFFYFLCFPRPPRLLVCVYSRTRAGDATMSVSYFLVKEEIRPI